MKKDSPERCECRWSSRLAVRQLAVDELGREAVKHL